MLYKNVITRIPNLIPDIYPDLQGLFSAGFIPP